MFPFFNWSMRGVILSIGMAKPTPWPSLDTAVFIPMTLPEASASGPPEFPGLRAASVWSSTVSRSVFVLSDRPRPEMIPEVTVGPPGARPRALPMATTGSPICAPADEPSGMGVSLPGFWIWMTATSSAVSTPSTFAW